MTRDNVRWIIALATLMSTWVMRVSASKVVR